MEGFMDIWRVISGLASRIRIWINRSRGVYIPFHCRLDGVEIPHHPGRIAIHAGVWLGRGVALVCPEKGDGSRCIVIGESACINRGTILDATQLVEIGKKCMIGPYCYITDHDHAFDGTGVIPGYVSKPTRLMDGCWLGAGVIVLKGVRIGYGAVIGAGSVVTRDVADGAVAAGIPARVLKMANDKS